MNILLLGAEGQLGRALIPSLSNIGEVSTPARSVLDICDSRALQHAVADIAPDLIINAAAFTDVDRAEEEEEEAFRVNAKALEPLVIAAQAVGAGILHYSTDYVFQGDALQPYCEDDPPMPLNTYGRSKLAGEELLLTSDVSVVVARLCWIYAADGMESFLHTMLRLFVKRDTVSVVDDQIGTPNSAEAIAAMTAAIIARACNDTNGPGFWGERAGLLHMSCAGQTSWYRFALAILRGAQARGLIAKDVSLLPCSSDAYPRPAQRPNWSVLSTQRLNKVFEVGSPNWHDALADVLDTLAAQ